MANPVDGDAIRMTNHDWAFSTESAPPNWAWTRS
ncbi:hypothetical protein LP419_33860 [Massilia sp. H-1]|nr:hypothetical protein LP419_33860 [Massilia sp. H-1]